jgi:hypothetical protein
VVRRDLIGSIRRICWILPEAFHAQDIHGYHSSPRHERVGGRLLEERVVRHRRRRRFGWCRRADLSRVTDNAFVGITSVPQPDGTQRATEIHVFPEDLRGLGEGSRPMTAQAGAGARSTMTNGSVAGSRMTNGSARMTNGAARMTNGTSRRATSGTVTVTYNGGSQTITVPPDVPVTVLVATTVKLAPGASVVVAGTRDADGTIRTSRVMLSGATPPRR